MPGPTPPELVNPADPPRVARRARGRAAASAPKAAGNMAAALVSLGALYHVFSAVSRPIRRIMSPPLSSLLLIMAVAPVFLGALCLRSHSLRIPPAIASALIGR